MSYTDPCTFFRGRNFMTPEIVTTGWICAGMAYELSTGRFMADELWGVTISTKVGGDPGHPASKCCHSEAEALAYIEQLKLDAGAVVN